MLMSSQRFQAAKKIISFIIWAGCYSEAFYGPVYGSNSLNIVLRFICEDTKDILGLVHPWTRFNITQDVLSLCLIKSHNSETVKKLSDRFEISPL